MNGYLDTLLAQATATPENAAPAAPQATAPAAAPAAPADPGQTTTQTTAPGDATPPADGQQPPKKGLFDGMLIPMLLIFVVMYFVMLRGPRKKQQQHKQMLDNLKKNDKIRTIGGILGTVVDVRDNEVVVKVDEATNTKMHIIRSAIAEVIVEPKA